MSCAEADGLSEEGCSEREENESGMKRGHTTPEKQ